MSVGLLTVIPPFGEKEAVFEDVLCPLHKCPLFQACHVFDRERKQKLVPEDTVLQTREAYFPSLKRAFGSGAREADLV